MTELLPENFGKIRRAVEADRIGNLGNRSGVFAQQLGGTFARTDDFPHVANGTIGEFEATDTMVMRGRAIMQNINWDGGVEIGYFTQGVAKTQIGISLAEPSEGESNPRIFAYVGNQTVQVTDSIGWNEAFNFDLTYSNGALTGNVGGRPVNVTGTPPTVNAFGVAVAPLSDDPDRQVRVFVDDLEYTAETTIGFVSGSSGDLETVTPAVLEVKLNGAEAGQTYTVDYAVIGGTATGGGVDYNLVEPNTLTFNPGQTIRTISIDVNDDGLDEEDETILVQLYDPNGPGVVLIDPNHTYTIIDPRPKISFAAASSEGVENITPVMIEVKLSQSVGETVYVDYEVTGGTATNGVEYNLDSPGTLTFEPGDVTEYIVVDLVDDLEEANDTTVILTLSNANPVPSCSLGAIREHTFTILDNDTGVLWEGKMWYFDREPSKLFVNEDGDLEMTNLRGDDGFMTRIPDQSLSEPGNVVEISYIFMTDGNHTCPDCFACPVGCYNDDITCIDGTSDIRFGLFESNGQYRYGDGEGPDTVVGYLGYGFRFGPNMMAGPTRWVDCLNETHKTGMFSKKGYFQGDLLMANEGLMDYIPGFELPPGEYSLLVLRLERLSSSSVKLYITLNGRTYTDVDDSSSDQPHNIDVFAFGMRNNRPYSRMVLSSLIECPGDFSGDNFVDEKDLKVIADDWLLTGGFGPTPDANYLVVHYNFDETSGSTAYDSSSPAYNGAVQVVSSGAPKTNAWDSGGRDAGCINFDGNTKVVVSSASSAFAGVSSAVTVALWVNGNAAVQPDPAWGMPFQAGKSGNDRVLLVHIPTPNNSGVMFESGGYNVQRLFWTGDSPSDWEGQWNHYVFTLDTATGLARIYCNGDKKAERTGATTGVGGISSFMVGNGLIGGTNYEYFGKIDDFRVYSYALSPDEVLTMHSGGQLPADSPANLYFDDIIDMKDYAEFAARWLDTCE